MTIFWLVVAIFYASLAVLTYVMSKPVIEALVALKTPDSLVSYSDKLGKEVGLESTLHAAYKSIIITDIIAFMIAGVAAIISAFSV